MAFLSSENFEILDSMEAYLDDINFILQLILPKQKFVLSFPVDGEGGAPRAIRLPRDS